jgi:HAD superfamily hydrolase (TIGR01509 family)
MIQAIIFDMDDVIVNSSGLHFQAYDKAMRDFGVSSPDIPDDMRIKIYGMRIREIMEMLARHFKMNVDVDELTNHRNAYFNKLVAGGVSAMPGLHTLVERIRGAGFKRAVASSGLREYVLEVLRQLKIDDFFEHVVTGEDVKEPKPSPESFLLAARKLGMKPKDCAVIEDSTNGLLAAKGAGMLAIGVKNPIIDSRQDMSPADIVVGRLDEITIEMLLSSVD